MDLGGLCIWAGVWAWGISKNDGFDTTRLGNRLHIQKSYCNNCNSLLLPHIERATCISFAVKSLSWGHR